MSPWVIPSSCIPLSPVDCAAHAVLAMICIAPTRLSLVSRPMAAWRTCSKPQPVLLSNLDPSLAPKDIAALADAGLTAYHAVKKASAILYPGTKTVVIGAGGLGHIGIQCLKALTPTEIIVVDRSPAALELTRSWGADHTVLVDGSQVAKVKDITDGQGAEAIIDFVGEGGAIEDGVAMLRRAGSYYVIGYGGKLNVPTIDIISTEINFIGNLVGTYNDLAELMVLTAQGKVTLHTAMYPLDAALDAIHALDSGNLLGRGILIP